jgi:hypothetical protein
MEGNSGGGDRSARLEVSRQEDKKEGPDRRISCRAPSSTERSGSDGCPLHGVGASTHAPLSRATDYHQWITSFRVNTRPRTDMASAAGGQGPVQWRPTGSAGTGSDTAVSDAANRRDRRRCRLLCYDSITWPRWGNRRRSRAAEMP